VLLLIIIGPIEINEMSNQGLFIFFYTIFVLFLFTLNSKKSLNFFNDKKYFSVKRIDLILFLFFSFIGILSLISYMGNISNYYGGYSQSIQLYSENALVIREDVENFATIDVQLSYFSWAAIFWGLMIIRNGNFKIGFLTFVSIIIFIQFIMNLAFIDRTRPIWIVFVSMIGWVFSKNINIHKKIQNSIIIFSVPLLIFIIFANFTKKVNEDFGIFGTMTAYIVSGIAYIDNAAVQPFESPKYTPVRTVMPISKTFEFLNLIEDVPNNVLENRSVPFDTNVGTIHEPYFSDGGLPFIILFFPILVFALNSLAQKAFLRRDLAGIFMWANCCFVMAISFFVPKFNSLPFYLFITIFLIVGIISGRTRGLSVAHLRPNDG
jgi:oligosaccharide repeat unit polymerase